MVTRLIYRLIVGLMTFVIGLGLTSVWTLLFIKPKPLVSESNVSLISDSSSDSAITLLILDAHPQRYLGKRIRLRDAMYPTDWQTLDDELIDIDRVRVDFKKRAELTIKLGKSEKSTYVSLGRSSCLSELPDVEVVGYLETKVEKDNSCNHYHISDARIVEVRRTYCY